MAEADEEVVVSWHPHEVRVWLPVADEVTQIRLRKCRGVRVVGWLYTSNYLVLHVVVVNSDLLLISVKRVFNTTIFVRLSAQLDDSDDVGDVDTHGGVSCVYWSGHVSSVFQYIGVY